MMTSYLMVTIVMMMVMMGITTTMTSASTMTTKMTITMKTVKKDIQKKIIVIWCQCVSDSPWCYLTPIKTIRHYWILICSVLQNFNNCHNLLMYTIIKTLFEILLLIQKLKVSKVKILKRGGPMMVKASYQWLSTSSFTQTRFPEMTPDKILPQEFKYQTVTLMDPLPYSCNINTVSSL